MARGKKIPTALPGFGHLERRANSANWYLVYRPEPNANRIVRSARTSDQESAYNELVKLKAQYATGHRLGVSAESATFADLFAVLEADYRRAQRTSTEDMIARVRKHLTPVFGTTRVLDLRKKQVERFVDDRLKALDPGSVNKLLAYIRRAMKLGMREDPPLVLRIPDWFGKVPGETVRTGTITPEMYEAIKHEMETAPHARLAFVLAYHTGMRRGAILQLRWDWIDWRDGVIVIPPDPGATTKHKPREVSIYGEMRAYLEMARAAAQTPYVVEFEGKPVKSIKTAWLAACDRAGLATAPLFHDLRRTAITRMESAGIPRHVAMEASGHKTQAVYIRYNIASRKATKAMGREMESFMQKEREAISAAHPVKQ
jgi:integrase